MDGAPTFSAHKSAEPLRKFVVTRSVFPQRCRLLQRNDLAEARTDFEEQGHPPAAGNGKKAAAGGTSEDPAEQIAKCRDKSQSIWIYFPHVELVFLLYAVQGSLTAQVAVLREGNSGTVFYAAAVALVSPLRQ